MKKAPTRSIAVLMLLGGDPGIRLRILVDAALHAMSDKAFLPILMCYYEREIELRNGVLSTMPLEGEVERMRKNLA